MDYCLEVGQFQLVHANQTNNMTMEILEEEAFLLLDNVNAFEAILEASKGKTGTIRKSLDRFIEILKNIYTKFINKVEELFRNDSKWLNENKQALLNKNYNDLSLKVVPFKPDVDANSITNTLKNLEVRLLRNNNADLTKYKERDNILKDFLSQYLDETGDFTDGCKNFFRIGNARGPVNYREYSGGALREKVTEMLSYCQTYKQSTVAKIEKEKNEIIKLMDRISDVESKNEKERFREENEQNKSKVEVVAKESFILLENCLLSDLFPSYNDILLEADKKGGPKPSTVEVESKGGANEKESNPYSGMSNEKLAVARILLSISQTVLAARLTVAEEKYKAYMTALVQLNRAGKTTDVEDSKVSKK